MRGLIYARTPSLPLSFHIPSLPRSISACKRLGLWMAAPAATLLSTPAGSGLVSSSAGSSGRSVARAFAYKASLGNMERLQRRKAAKFIANAVSIAAPTVYEVKECSLPTWADFDIGRAPIFWKTMNGLPPTSGEMLTIFYNPAASGLDTDDDFGVAFNGGFNQPVMCGGEPRAMKRKTRGKADPPIYTIKICIPKHAVSLIFSFTNGVDWDGPYKLEVQALKAWRNKPMSFFNEGLAAELGNDGACERAIFPDSHAVIMRCAMIGNLTVEGGDRCNLDWVPGCTDPSSHLYNPLATVDDGSCPLELESEGA